MKVLQINIFGNLSTGRIAVDLYRVLQNHGHDGLVAFARNTIADDVKHIRFGTKWTIYADGIMSRITDKAGFYSKKPTRELIERIKEYDPDIIHLHNLHGYYINIELLFDYLIECGKPVVWTLHDCWSFTGHCCYFENIRCEKWKTGCFNCEQKTRYPASFFRDNSEWNYKRKKELFTSVDNMVLVTPSEWLKNLVEQSYMNKFPTHVIRNGVDLETFKPTYGDWAKTNRIDSKKIVLGVAGTWSPTKGLSDMCRLSEMLSEKYQVVVVGVDKKQKKDLPGNVIGIERTYDSRELAEIYSTAEYFVNPTYDDNFPTVNIEALACGTPVITYRTGGSPEAVDDESGAVVDVGDIEAVANVIKTCSYSSEMCCRRGKYFSKELAAEKYIEIYGKLLNG